MEIFTDVLVPSQFDSTQPKSDVLLTLSTSLSPSRMAEPAECQAVPREPRLELPLSRYAAPPTPFPGAFVMLRRRGGGVGSGQGRLPELSFPTDFAQDNVVYSGSTGGWISISRAEASLRWRSALLEAFVVGPQTQQKDDLRGGSNDRPAGCHQQNVNRQRTRP